MNNEQMQAVERAKRHNLFLAAKRFVRSNTALLSYLDSSQEFVELKRAVEALDSGATAD